MKKSIIIFLSILSGYCSVLTSQTKGHCDFLLPVNKDLPKYGFNVEEIDKGEDTGSYLLKIYQSDSDSLIQIIHLDHPDEPPYIDSLIDVNFDGYKDLCFVSGLGENGKNQSYDILLFDPADKKFHYNDGIPSIINLSVDESRKLIYEHYFTGGLDCSDVKTYIVKDNKLVLIEVDTQYWKTSYNPVRFIEKYKDGKMISRKEVDPR